MLEDNALTDIFTRESFNGRVYVVTGGARGIGHAVADSLGRLGARVLVLDCDQDRIRQLSQEQPELIKYVYADVTDGRAVTDAVTSFADRHGGVDGVVNNAMLNPQRTFAEGGLEQFARAWEVNVLAAYRLIGICLPRMRRGGGGSVVNVSSVMAHRANGRSHAYSSSKSALEGLTRALSVELAEHRIRVNAVLPGYIRTYAGFAGRDVPPNTWSDAMRRQAIVIEHLTRHSQPWPEHGRPEDVAGAILFLLSDASRFITGSCLTVDGGFSAEFRQIDHDAGLDRNSECRDDLIRPELSDAV